MGNCCLDGYIDGLGQDSDAVGCYSACIAMRPDFHAAYANRGLMRLRRGQFAEAEADFTRAVQLRPDRAEYLPGPGAGPRGPAPRSGGVGRPRLRRKNLARRPCCSTTCGRRSISGWAMKISARRDLDHVLRLTPDDETGFTARGLARASDGDMEAALADFTEAVKRNPNSVPGLQDQATVLAAVWAATARRWRRWTGCWNCTRRSPGRAARAVVRARLGMRDEAVGRCSNRRWNSTRTAARRCTRPPRRTPCWARARGGPGGGVPAVVPGACRRARLGPTWSGDDDLASLRNDPRLRRPDADGGVAADGREIRVRSAE